MFVSIVSSRDTSQRIVETDNKEHTPEAVVPSTFSVAPMLCSAWYILGVHALLMTCKMLVHATDGTCVQARGLLDSVSSISFIFE